MESRKENLKMKEFDVHLENFMDRTMRTLGKKTMGKLRESSILVVGAGGLGIEICKNLILTGVRTVTLYDDQICQWKDMSTNFCINEIDVKQGNTRINASKEVLKDLTPSFVRLVLFDAVNTDLSIEQIWDGMDVVIFTEHVYSEQLYKWNQQLREKNIKFITCEARGLCGRVFVDFLDHFTIQDTNAENPTQNVIIGIDKGTVTTVFVNDKRRNHGLQDGDYVTFEGVSGMTHINGQEYRVLKVINTHSFIIDLDSNQFPTFGGHGVVIQVKKPKIVDFKPLKEAMKQPEYMIYDYTKFEYPEYMHNAFCTLGEYVAKYQQLPRPHHTEDITNFVKMTHIENENGHKMKDDNEESQEATCYHYFAATSAGQLNPVVTFLGGIVAQEALKGVSGKYTPIHQFFYFDALECVTYLPSISAEEASPQQCRYDGQIAVFGKTFQQKLQQLKVFLVGVGALGCEYLKNLALMGISAGSDTGKIVCTDLDSIELSNLSRQFLFRERHIGRMKSDCAAEMVSQMNPTIQIKALQDKVSSETEVVFHTAFWESIDLVVNALDNDQARRYVDLQCVHYWLPLIEAGTLGAKGNVQVVVPNLTENYGASQDPPEEETHMCTIKNFPYEISHTIIWAKSCFENLFQFDMQHLKDFLVSPKQFLAHMEEKDIGTQVNIYDSLISNIIDHRCTTFSDCVLWARERFQHYFHNIIVELLANFPLDSKTSQGGQFWIGDKRPPTAIIFNMDNPLHFDFLRFAARLRATCFQIAMPQIDTTSSYSKYLSDYVPAKFVPTKQEIDGDDVKMVDDEHEDRKTTLLQSLQTFINDKLGNSYNHCLNGPFIMEFEKDNDSNYHVDFITAASNLRASNYSIAPASRLHTKGIAGQIVPAMITTTASITGLGMLELYKVVQNLPSLERSYKNTFLNLSLPFCIQSEPAPPALTCMLSNKMVSIWERVNICAGRDILLRDFIKYFQLKFKLKLEMIIWKKYVIYNVLSSPSKFLKMHLSELVSQQSKTFFPPQSSSLYLDVACCDPSSNEDVDIPTVRYQFRHFDEAQLAKLKKRKKERQHKSKGISQ